MSCDTLRFTFWDSSIEQLFKLREFFQFWLFRGLSWCIGSWPIDSSRWLVYCLFQQCEHPGYWGIFLFLVLVVRPRVIFHFDPESFFPILEPGALDLESFSITAQSHSFPFRARSSRPRVIIFYFRAWSSRPRVIFSITAQSYFFSI